MQSIAGNSANANVAVVNSPMNGPGGAGGVLNSQKDSAEAQTAAKFGEVLQNIQAKYGEKAEKPREIKKTLGKDDFLRIMITQMRHQDPTSPFKAEQMATEMAQFTSVEQLQNLNQNMQKMMDKNTPLERMAMTNLIGKSVTVDRNRFAHVDGQNDSIGFKLQRPAKEVKVVLINEGGEVVLEKDIGAQKQGEGSFTWDGKRSNTLPAKAGNYMVRIEAKDENGSPVASEGVHKVRVVGVSFEGGEAVLLVGDNNHQEKVPLKTVTRIEGEAPAIPGAMPLGGGAAPAADASQAAPNFISFQKGVGSGDIGTAGASAEAQAALAKFAQQQAMGAVGNAPSQQQRVAHAPSAPGAQAQNSQANSASSATIKAEGFPNGLHDDDSNNKLER